MGVNTATKSINGNLPFRLQVEKATPGDSRLQNCIQCGTCGGTCPSHKDMNHSPRKIFGMIQADMKSEVLESNTFWYCVSCYYCISRCPQNVQITDIMYSLKQMAIKEGYYKRSDATIVPDFSGTFMDYVRDYGRSFELGLATRFHLKHNPLGMISKISMGVNMILRGRFDLTPKRIKGIDGLKAILAKAEEIEGEL